MSSQYTQKNQNSQSPEGIFPVYKRPGETLATLVARFRVQQSLPATTPITYAGRLDPMAEGLVLLLVGESCKEKDRYLGLNKKYECEILFGVSTDTFDMLGLVTDITSGLPTPLDIAGAIEIVQRKTVFPYPPYSSKPVGGKALFLHAKAGTLPPVMPFITGQIQSMVLQSVRTVRLADAINDKIKDINTVQGEFRQSHIVQGWKGLVEKWGEKECVIASCEIDVSSGIYVRVIATMIGEVLGIPAVAYSINRKTIGSFTL